MMEKRCVVIGSAPDTKLETIGCRLHGDEFIACADGGYIYAEKLGLSPDLVAGDFDSSPRPEKGKYTMIVLPVKKDDTDSVYIVRKCMELGMRDFLLFGMTGGRADHTFASYCLLADIAYKGARARLIDESFETEVIVSGKRIIREKKGCGFSVFPFGCESCTVSLSGFEYELDGGVLSSRYPVGVSNRITEDIAEITVIKGAALIMTENRAEP